MPLSIPNADLGGPAGTDAVKPVLLEAFARQFGLWFDPVAELPPDLVGAATP